MSSAQGNGGQDSSVGGNVAVRRDATRELPDELCRESCGGVQRVSSEATARTQPADLPGCGRKMETV
ncbi:Hypp947 [Branchiostoma lanceolatum]|uniref:Hypp947 protein n=1 Tax=Branchiostoma lanceolatum TaxID=7740 RepID=A0A8J9ZF83_BRALA|nr:Hypp947 [Branchiostoma lanceolatum]